MDYIIKIKISEEKREAICDVLDLLTYRMLALICLIVVCGSVLCAVVHVKNTICFEAVSNLWLKVVLVNGIIVMITGTLGDILSLTWVDMREDKRIFKPIFIAIIGIAWCLFLICGL